MAVNKIKQFLDAHGVRYLSIRHSPAYTAQETAASAHVRGKDLAKTVMVKIDGEMAMAVLPASRRLDLARLQASTQAKTLELAAEAEFAGRFPDCDTGATAWQNILRNDFWGKYLGEHDSNKWHSQHTGPLPQSRRPGPTSHYCY